MELREIPPDNEEKREVEYEIEFSRVTEDVESGHGDEKALLSDFQKEWTQGHFKLMEIMCPTLCCVWLSLGQRALIRSTCCCMFAIGAIFFVLYVMSIEIPDFFMMIEMGEE